MHDAVPGADKLVVAQVVFHPVQHLAYQLLMGLGRVFRPVFFQRHLAARLDAQMRRGADALGQPLGNAGQFRTQFEQCEFDAGGAGVDGENGISHDAALRP